MYEELCLRAYLHCYGSGLAPEASTPISTFFPQLASDPDPRKPAITLEQLLTMTAGFNWDEFGGQNSFPRMTRTGHWVDFVLEQSLRHKPGTHMEYNSGVSQILSAILMQHTELSVAAYAERYLFGPLGIHDYEWEQDPQGVHTGGFGMKLLPADLLKFGQLFLQQGRWKKNSSYPATWSNVPRSLLSLCPLPTAAVMAGTGGWINTSLQK